MSTRSIVFLSGVFVFGATTECPAGEAVSAQAFHDEALKCDYRNNLRGGRNATSAQVIKVLLCPSHALRENPIDWTNVSQH